MGTAMSKLVNSLMLRTIARLACMFAFAQIAPASAQATIVVLGDSNTQGYGVAPQQAFPARLEATLRASGRAVQVVNAGVALDTLGRMLARLDTSVPAGTRIVVVQGGFNDIDQDVPANVSAANMRAILAR